jgi:DNA-binding winged helix-turn-helix (wHTH) protein/tetratricopeptide (TPR) repeat protein
MGEVERIGDFEIDRRLFQLRWRGDVVHVERRVFDLISYLLTNHDRVVSKEELFGQVWQGRVVSSGSLAVAINAARRALRDDSKSPQVIITHRGRGYRINLGSDTEQLGGNKELSAGASFVGRDAELRLLAELLEGSGTGRPALAVVLGEPGIGKSRLVEEFAEIASRRGAQAVVGRCREDDGAPPYWPWIQIARTLCAAEVNQSAASQLALEAPEIAQSIPELWQGREVEVASLPPPNARFRLFDAFSRFIEAAAERQAAVVILDDVHRSDIDSLLLLDFLACSVRSGSLLLVVTYRPRDLSRGGERFNLLASAIRGLSGRSLQLRGLSVEDVSRLVRSSRGWSPTHDQARILERLTGGNPFFLNQLTSMLSRDGAELEQASSRLPSTVRDAIVQQLDGLSESTVLLLRAAAVVGREFRASILVDVQRVAPVEISGCLDEAIEAGILSQAGDSYRFSHVLVRDVLYQSLGRSERARLHAAVGEALERSSLCGTKPLAEIAFRYAEAAIDGNVGRAVLACRAAADQSREAVAYSEAVGHHRRALEMLERYTPDDSEQICSVLLALGSDQVRTGDRNGAKVSFDLAARIAEAMGLPERVAEAALGISPGFFAVEAGAHDELLVTLLRRSQGRLGPEQVDLKALVLARLGMALFWTDSDGESGRLSLAAWEIARERSNPHLKLQVLLARWLAEWGPYAVDDRRRIAEQAIALAREVANRESLAVALLLGLVGALESGAIEHFDRLALEFNELADQLRQPQAIWYAGLLAAARDLHSGEFARAEERALAFSEIGRRIGDANASLSRMAQGLVLASERGDARQILAISEEAHRQYPLFYGWRASRCWALARSGDAELAVQALGRLRATALRDVPRKLDWPTAMVLLAETAFLLRDTALAEELHELLLPLQGRHLVLGFCVMTWGPISRYLGLASETMGRRAEAAGWYEQALEESRRSHGRPWEAHSAFGLSRVMPSGSGSRDQARHALSIGKSLGMRQIERDICAWISA